DDDVSHYPLRPTIWQALPNVTPNKPQPAGLPLSDLTDRPADVEGPARGISGQIAVKRATGRGFTAPFTKPLNPNYTHGAVECEGHHITNPDRMTGCGHALSVSRTNPAVVRAAATLRVRTMRACHSHLSIR